MRMTEAEYVAMMDKRNTTIPRPVPAKKDALQEIIEAKGFTPSPKASKYGNKKVVVDGITFHSKREANRWQQLNMLAKAGKIADLQRQVPFILAPSVVIDGRKRPALKYVADFTYYRAESFPPCLVVEDSKGCLTEGFKLKRHLMKSVLDIDILLT